MTLTDAVRRIHSGEVSSRELVESCLGRIADMDDSIGAWARLREAEALVDADVIDSYEKGERSRLPLAGIPVGVKDVFSTARLETSAGSSALRGWVPSQDAAAVRRLRQAGAIVLGKTVTTEFASAVPAATKNPVDPNHSPGGSSAGSAAALAADMCLGALGTQTAGSIVRPAAYCGVVGLKPTYGAVSREGVIPLAWSMDHVGPMAKTVEDVALLYGQIANDGEGREQPLGETCSVGVPDRYFEETTEEVAAAFDSALGVLRGLGWTVRSVHLPDSFEAAVKAALVIIAVEIAAVHQDWFEGSPDAYSPQLRAVIEIGQQIAGPSYVRAQRIRRVAAAEVKGVFDDVDLLVTPATPATAPRGFASTGDPRFNTPFSALGLPALTLPIPAPSTHLPVGLQLVADHGCDWTLLTAGHRLESFVK